MGDNTKIKQGKAVIVGGSIAGLSSAHALISAGWDVVVLEKSSAPPKGSPTGAGLGLDSLSLSIIRSWLPSPELLESSSLPLNVDQNQAIDGERKVISRILSRDDNFTFRTAHWAVLHDLLHSVLPQQIFLWGHLFVSFSVSDDRRSVSVKAKNLKTDEILDIQGNLLVAADGILSSIRKAFLPDLKLRYSGYCAWRGVLNYSGIENSETISGVKKAYPELGKCLYIDLSRGSHTVFLELPDKRLNWLWFVCHPEPDLKGHSVTMKVSHEMVENMYHEAEKIWLPEFVSVIKETKEPFINFLYDCDPLDKIFWDNVVLVGDAAHPTTPHGARSTNMSIVDGEVLGRCIKKWGVDNLPSALEEYERIRSPVTSKQVLHARRMGQIKQGLPLPDREVFDPFKANPQDCEELHHKSMPFFYSVPLAVD